MSQGTTIEDRLAQLESRWEHQDQRLAHGARTFAEFREAQAEIHKKVESNGLSLTKLALMVAAPTCGLLVFIGGLVWQAARYPDREEFDAAKEQVYQIKLKQERMAGDIDALAKGMTRIEDQTNKIEMKLDAVLTRVRD